jgi:hypothetical protein
MTDHAGSQVRRELAAQSNKERGMSETTSGRMFLGLCSSMVAPPPPRPVQSGSVGDTKVAERASRIDAQFVIYRLEEAGCSMLAMPNTGYSTRLRSSALDVLRSAMDMQGWDQRDSGRTLRPPMPDSAQISRMDEAMGWLKLIPADKVVLRRIVGARSLVSPITERHLYAWRRLGNMLGADHKAVQRWHAQGIEMIVAGLNRFREVPYETVSASSPRARHVKLVLQTKAE